MSTQFRNLLLLPSAFFLCLAGCGGGGDGSGLVPNPTPTTGNLVTISSTNAPMVAGVAAQEVLENDVLGTLTATGLPIAGSGAPAVLLGLAGPVLPPGIAGSQIVLQDCAVSGTVDVDITLADPTTISQGDEFSFQFNACDDGTGAVLNGGFAITITAFQGAPGSEQFTLGMSVELSAFQVTQGGNVTGATGTISIEIDSMPPITTITVSTSALTSTHNGVTETITNVSVTVTEDNSTSPTAVTVEKSFRISSPRLGGDVIVSTSVALQSSGDEFPFAGELRIQAANNSSIVLIALDSNMVRLLIDINGDGTTDETRDTTWADLMAAADAA